MPQINYFEISDLPGQQFFYCQSRAATIKVSNCKQMFIDADNTSNIERHERLALCRNCPIGAMHTGVADMNLAPVCGSNICSRCEAENVRLVKKDLCVSCYNRQREYLIGKNARGKFPVTHPALYAMKVKIVESGVVKFFTKEKCANSTELVLSALRDCKKQVTFGFSVVKFDELQELF